MWVNRREQCIYTNIMQAVKHEPTPAAILGEHDIVWERRFAATLKP
jgi:hypothetical protein